MLHSQFSSFEKSVNDQLGSLASLPSLSSETERWMAEAFRDSKSLNPDAMNLTHSEETGYDSCTGIALR